MFDPSKELQERATAYATARDIELKQVLGGGKDGSVYATNFGTAVKAFRQPDTFNRELACYMRLEEMEVRNVLGHNIPRLHAVDVSRHVIEMSIVQPPFLLDFASAYLDYPPDFSD